MRYTKLGFSPYMFAIALNEVEGVFVQRVTENSIMVFDLLHDEREQLFLFDSKQEAEDFIKNNQIKMTLFENLTRQSLSEQVAA